MERATTVEADANGVGQWDILEIGHWLYVTSEGRMSGKSYSRA
jgi:hypothetical protein